MRYSHKLFIILCLSGTGFSTPALAQDVPPAVQALLSRFEQQTNVKPTYEAIETAADGSVTITKLSLKKPSEGNGPSITMRVDEMVLSDISDEGDGLYEIGGASFSNITCDVSGDRFAVTIYLPQASAEDWYLLAAGDNPTPEAAFRANANMARKMSGGKMTVAVMGQTYTVDGFQSTWKGDPATGAGTTSMKFSNIAIPEQAIALVDQGGMLKQLGYGGLSFDIESNSTAEIAGGDIGMSADINIRGRDIGTFKFGLAAADVPLAIYAALQNAQKTGKEPDVNALLPQVQGITLSEFSLRFEDQSITGKLLPMLATMQGTDEAALVANAGAMMQVGLMQLQNQAFSEQAAAAVNAFLKDPKSLTITAKPAEPLKVSDIMAMNPAQPGEIISRIGLGVSAND